MVDADQPGFYRKLYTPFARLLSKKSQLLDELPATINRQRLSRDVIRARRCAGGVPPSPSATTQTFRNHRKPLRWPANVWVVRGKAWWSRNDLGKRTQKTHPDLVDH